MPAVVNDISEDTMLGPRRDPSDSASSAAPASGPTLGEVLRSRREARGLTPHQAAGQLRLLPRWIEAFESNRFDALGAPVYARGYLRKYAALLELPVDEVLAQYDQLIDIPAPPPLAPIKSTGSEPVTTSRAPSIIGGIALVSVAAALIISVGQMDQPVQPAANGQSQTTATTSEAPAEPAAPIKVAATSETSPALAATTETVAAADTSQPATAEAVPETGAELTASTQTPAAPETALAAVPATQATPSDDADDIESAAAAAAAEDPEQPLARVAVPMTQSGKNLKIKLSFKGKSWTTVYAADGTKLLYELSRRGRPRTVTSPPPLTVVFGAIDAVEMRVNDKNVTIPRQPGKDSIKFVLDVEDAQAGTRSADAGG